MVNPLYYTYPESAWSEECCGT